MKTIPTMFSCTTWAKCQVVKIKISILQSLRPHVAQRVIVRRLLTSCTVDFSSKNAHQSCSTYNCLQLAEIQPSNPPQTTWPGGNKNHTKRQQIWPWKSRRTRKKVVSPVQDAVKTWLSECASFSDANVPEAAILFIVARHNMGHLPVSVSVIPSPCFINLPLYGPREWSCGGLDGGSRGGWVRPKRWPSWGALRLGQPNCLMSFQLIWFLEEDLFHQWPCGGSWVWVRLSGWWRVGGWSGQAGPGWGVWCWEKIGFEEKYACSFYLRVFGWGWMFFPLLGYWRVTLLNSKHLIRWAQVCWIWDCWTGDPLSGVIWHSREQIKLQGRGATGGLLCSVHCPRNNTRWCLCHLVTPLLSWCPPSRLQLYGC